MQLKVKAGHRLLLDVQDGMMVLIPEPKSYANYLQGLHSEIWKGVDIQQYLNGESGAWSKIKP